MLSRVASNLFWMGRYLERAENTARLINVNSHLLMDLPTTVKLGWEPIIDILSARDGFYDHYDQADEHSVVKYMITDKNNPSSIINSLTQARENARTVREIIPTESWEQINSLYQSAMKNRQSMVGRRHRYEALTGVIRANQTLTGILAGIMTHDEGYAFLRLGRNLERGDMTTRIIDVRSATLLPELKDDQSAFENIQWMGVLKSLSAYQMYRQKIRLRINRPDVLKFLFQEERFPRSLTHTLSQVKSLLHDLPHKDGAIEAIDSLKSRLSDGKPQKLNQEDLHEFIDEMQVGLMAVAEKIDETYF